jgi:hypothetical protein
MRKTMSINASTVLAMRDILPDMSDDKRIECLTNFYKLNKTGQDIGLLNEVYNLIRQNRP